MTDSASLGAAAALASSATWAFASVRYAEGSRTVGGPRVSRFRAVLAVPIYWAVVVALHHTPRFAVSPRQVAWLLGSVLCSYVTADVLFFGAARRLGASTALAIASTYPLWASLGGLFSGQSLGAGRAAGCFLCVGGVVTLVYLSGSGGPKSEPSSRASSSVGVGVALALLTSALWAGNSLCVNRGAVGLDVWRVNALRYSMALVILSAFIAVRQARDANPPVRPPRAFWWGLVPATLIDAIAGSVFFVYGLSHAALAVAATLSSLAPFLSVPVAVWRGQEPWDLRRFLAIIATVGGVALLILSGPSPQ